MHSSRRWCLVLFLLALLPPDRAVAAPDFAALEKSVVRIVTQTSQGPGTGTGFAINDQGYIATNAHVIAHAHSIQAIPTNTNELYDVEVIATSQEFDLAIAYIPDITLPPLALSLAPAIKGQKVWSIGYPGGADRNRPAHDPTVQDGVIGRIFWGAWHAQELRIIQHNAPTNPGNSGGPLLDDCSRAVGVNTQASLVVIISPSSGVTRVPHAAGIYWSSHVEELANLLDDHSIAFLSERDDCVAAGGAGSSGSSGSSRGMEKALREAEKAQREAEKAQSEAEKAEKAQSEAEKARREAEQARVQAEEATDQFFVWLLLLGGVALVSLVVALKKPRQFAQQTLEKPRQFVQQMSRRVTQKKGVGAVAKGPKYGIALAGFDGRGNRVCIELLPARFAGQRLGLSLGRRPDLVDEIVADENVSRRHLRIVAEGDRFYVEDLNSSNGTFLNEQRLEPFKPMRLNYGAKVALGDLVLVASKL